MSTQTPGTLYLVATPIGNLGDISFRAVETLRQVDFIAAEDTRVTRKLLNYLEIKKQLVSFHEHNSRESGEKVVIRILRGESCALVTDAGMPCISDPGEDITRMCGEVGILITAIPGPCAAVMALALSGLPSGRFVFEGFLSTARKSRFERLEELKTEQRTMIFYEAPHKLIRTLHDMMNAFGDRRVSISRELTKLFEETRRFTLSEAVKYFEENPPRGEFALVLEGTQKSPVAVLSIDDAVSMAKIHIESGLSVKDAVKIAAGQTGVPKNALYNAVIKE